MRSSVLLQLCIVLVAITSAMWQAEARGGRGRGGGIFGTWRKYKKAPGQSTSRRYVNSSPSQYVQSKPVSVPDAGGAAKHGHHHAKHHRGHKDHNNNNKAAVYPKQHAPMGGSAHGYNLPPESTYYASAAAMPPGAIYYAQAPRTSDTGDFVFGMLAGHMLSRTFYGNPLHVTHVHPQTPDANRVIIINNGDQGANETGADINDTTEASQVQHSTSAAPPDKQNEHTETLNGQEPLHATAEIPSGGIICMPMIFNETDPNDATVTHEVKKLVCFPAPPPPPGQHVPLADCASYEDCRGTAIPDALIAGDIVDAESTQDTPSDELTTAHMQDDKKATTTAELMGNA